VDVGWHTRTSKTSDLFIVWLGGALATAGRTVRMAKYRSFAYTAVERRRIWCCKVPVFVFA
jgi:hypothetical protein